MVITMAEKEVEKIVKKEAKAEVKKKKRSRKKGMTSKSKKKEAKARALIKRGKGRVFINKRNVSLLEPKHVNDLVSEPLMLAGELTNDVDIYVNSTGGGFMGQAVATRAAIAKALVEYYSSNEKLKQKFLAYDRLLLVDDPRRVEPKKPLGKKARKKKQSSKR